MKTEIVTPLRQGDLDSLCGLYSIVNGIRLAAPPDRPITKGESHRLFRQGMMFLEGKGCGDIVRLGLDSKSWHRVARHMFDYLHEKGIADFKCGKGALRPLPGDLGAAIEMIENAVKRGIPVAIELKKAWKHYTVVSSVDEDGWGLFDSQGYKNVKRKSLGIVGSGARHELGPRAIIFVPRF